MSYVLWLNWLPYNSVMMKYKNNQVTVVFDSCCVQNEDTWAYYIQTTISCCEDCTQESETMRCILLYNILSYTLIGRWGVM